MFDFIKLFRKTFFKKINKNFYSQFGEDKILNEILDKDYKNGFYVDVGCFHHKKYSNTYLLFKKGWSGINIDLEQDKIDVFNLARPYDHNILSAVSDVSQKLTVYKTDEYSVGTTTKKSLIKDMNNVIDTFDINSKTLNNIIENSPFNNKEIDLLNIDTEGNDYSVLMSLNLDKYKPKIIIIESHLKNINEIIKCDIYNYLSSKNYKLRSWNFYSLIFISEIKKNIRDR